MTRNSPVRELLPTVSPGPPNPARHGRYDSQFGEGQPPINPTIIIDGNTSPDLTARPAADPADFARTLEHEIGHHTALFLEPDHGGFGPTGVWTAAADAEPANRINDVAERTPGAFGTREDFDHNEGPGAKTPGSGHAEAQEANVTAEIAAALSRLNYIVGGPHDD